MRHRWFYGAGSLLSLLLMALPCSVGMEAGQASYLSFSPIGHGNWFPLLAVGFTVLAMVFLLLRKDFRQMTPVCLGLSVVSQMLSWILFGTFTLVSATAVLLQLSVLAQDAKTAWALRTEQN